jgi:peptide/nickel transport system ATP-binding protein
MNVGNIIEVKNLTKWYKLRGSFIETLKGKKILVKAVDSVSFGIKQGETLALVGESGSGKTTVGRLLLNLIPKTFGEIYFDGREIESLMKKDELKFRRDAQIVLQDAFGSLNPRMTVYNLIGESIDVHGLTAKQKEKEEMIIRSMEAVDLIPIKDIINKYPNELSGGQMQRVAIARALVLNPKFIVCDEPVSMLDASIRANVLNLFISLRKKFNISILFITHDIAVARYVSHSIAIMYLGKIVEIGSTEEIINEPLHPYTRALFLAVLTPDPAFKSEEINIKGEISDAINLPPGCSFYPRCPLAQSICSNVEPSLEEKHGHLVACHFA